MRTKRSPDTENVTPIDPKSSGTTVEPESAGTRWIWAAVIVVLAGVLFWGILPEFADQPELFPEGSVATSTAPATTPTTVASIEVAPVEVIEPTETALGTLIWTASPDDGGMLARAGITYDPNSGLYISQNSLRIWRSLDGLHWTMDRKPWLDLGLSSFWIEGEWAIGDYGDDVPVLFRARQWGEWEEVELPPIGLPDITGVVWDSSLTLPRVSESLTLIEAHYIATIPWETHYETDEGEIEALWNFRELLFINERRAFRSMNLARLRMEREGSRIIFTDNETGEVVHTITTPDDTTAGTMAENIRGRRNPWSIAGVWVGTSASDLEFHDAPWDPENFGQIVVVPDGGFAAFEFPDYDRVSFEPEPLLESRVWTSPDGVIWTDRGVPAFSDEDTYGPIEMTVGSLTLRANPNLWWGPGPAQTWVSTDAVNWTSIVSPTWSDIYPTEFGYVTVDSEPPHPQFLVSADGNTWERVTTPSGDGFGVAGNLLWVSRSTGEEETLWIGTFEERS